MFKSSITCITCFAALVFAGCEKDTTTRYERMDSLGSAKDSPVVTPTPSTGDSHEGHDHSHDHDHDHDHSNESHSTAQHSAQNSTKPTTAPTTASIDAGNIPEPPKVSVRQGEGSDILEVAGIAFTVNPKWEIPKTKGSSFRAAEYIINGPGGPAEMAIFYFGPNQGGDTESNIRRWAGQFTADETTTGTGVEVGRIVKEKDNLNVALVRTHGTYNPGSMGPAGPADTGPKPHYSLFGLVVEGGPQGAVFVKVTGPTTTIEHETPVLEAFADSVRVSRYK